MDKESFGSVLQEQRVYLKLWKLLSYQMHEPHFDTLNKTTIVMHKARIKHQGEPVWSYARYLF